MFGHKKADCRDWLKLTKEERDKGDKEQQEKLEEKPKKNGVMKVGLVLVMEVCGSSPVYSSFIDCCVHLHIFHSPNMVC